MFKNIIQNMLPELLLIRMQKIKYEKDWSDEEYANLLNVSPKVALSELSKPWYSQRDAEMYKIGVTLDERKKKQEFCKICN